MMRRRISLAGVDVGPAERAAVLSVLESGRLALGPVVSRFERMVADYTGVRHAVAVSSGTAGLHLLVRAFGLGEGDEVITTPFSFVASANCLLYERVRPVFVDIAPDTLCLDPARVEAARTERTRAILAVDVFGHPADWPALRRVAQRHRLVLIEDSCEALGAGIGPISHIGPIRRCGSFGDAAVFAFYPNKQITTGEGGMVVTDRAKIAGLCRSMANQGRREVRHGLATNGTRDPEPGTRLRQGSDKSTIGNRQPKIPVAPGGRWLEHVRLGYNYRMSELAAALGVAQMQRLDEILARRRRVAALYDEMLADLPGVSVPFRGSGAGVSWFVYVVRLAGRYTRRDRDRVLARLRDRGIECSDYFRPIHLQPFYRRVYGYRRGDFPIAESVGDRTIALPFAARMSAGEVRTVVRALSRALVE